MISRKYYIAALLCGLSLGISVTLLAEDAYSHLSNPNIHEVNDIVSYQCIS